MAGVLPGGCRVELRGVRVVTGILARSLDEALTARGRHPGAELLAGGTDLMVRVNLERYRPPAVVTLRHVPELGEWSGRRIGAGVTYRRLERDGQRALAQLARTVGSPQIRSTGTIGGNVGTASPAGDTLPWIAAADAAIEVRSLRGVRELPWREFFVGVKRTALAADEVITAVVLPAAVPERQEFAKIGVRNAMVIAIVCACVMRAEDDTWRIALGSVAPTVMRAVRAEQLLAGERRPSAAALDAAQRAVEAEVSPITDHRASAAYRRRAAGVLVRRLVERCAT